MPSIPPRAGDPVPLVDAMPAPIDSTSFRVKGHIYQKMKDNIADTIEGGMDRLLERVDSAEVREFIQRPFFGGSWYDALPLGPLSYAHARLLGNPIHSHSRERGRIVATHDVPGIYKALLRIFSPATLISRLPRAATFYFNFGTMTAEQPTDGRARVALAGLPFSLAPMLAGVIEGFVGVALVQSGAKDVIVRTLDVTYDGHVVDRIPTAVVRCESSWRV